MNYIRTFKTMFDRSERYAELAQSCRQTSRAAREGSESEARRMLSGLEAKLRSIQASDFLPDKASERASCAVKALRREIDRRFSPDEPLTHIDAIQRRSIAAFRGKTWATRHRPWVDRLATAWLVKRFIDEAAHFVWLEAPRNCPKGAIGFDYHGAAFSHLNGKVTFEVVFHAFGLSEDDALKAMGDLVHFVDVGGNPVEEAAGVELAVRGLQVRHQDDDELQMSSMPLFDSLYGGMKVSP